MSAAAAVSVSLVLMLLALAPAPAGARVVLIGVDGGSWNLIDPSLDDMSQLRAIAERGVTGNLSTVRPVSSPTVWTSIATGREPDAHGIQSFYATARNVRVATTWDRLAAQGLRVGLYDYLMTWPPRELPGGFVIPGWLRRDDRTAPPDVFARAGLERYAYSLDDVRAPEEILANCRVELAEKPGRFVRLMNANQLDVAVVTFYSVDATSHRFWDDSFPEDFEEGRGKPDPRYRGVIREMVRGVDRAIGTIAASLGPEDTLLVASDHGFMAQEGVRRVWATDVEEWIARTDLEPERDGFEIATGFGFVIFRVLPGPFAEREATLQRLVELIGSARSPEGEPLFRSELLDVAPRPRGAERSWPSWLRQQGVRMFLWWNDVVLNEPAHGWVFGVPQGEVLDRLWPDGEVRLGDASVPIRRFTQADDFSGAHDPVGIFLAAGRGIRAQSKRIDVSVLDIAALLFYLSDRPIPDDLDGTLPEAVIDPEFLASHPARTVAAASLPTLEAPVAAGAEAADDDEVTRRLRSLGYVE